MTGLTVEWEEEPDENPVQAELELRPGGGVEMDGAEAAARWGTDRGGVGAVDASPAGRTHPGSDLGGSAPERDR